MLSGAPLPTIQPMFLCVLLFGIYDLGFTIWDLREELCFKKNLYDLYVSSSIIKINNTFASHIQN
jgi:hypothetical protein